MVNPQAFLAIEDSLTLRLSDTLQALMDEAYPAIQTAIEDGDYDKAERMVQAIDLDPVFDLNENYIVYLSRVAMLFGASLVSDDPATTSVGLGFEKTIVDTVVASFRQTITVNALEHLRDSAVTLIALKRSPPVPQVRTSDSSYLGSVLKAAKPSAVLPFSSFMDKQGKSFFNMASSLHTSRLSAFGFTAEAKYLGYTQYQINEQLDGRTCEVCRLMHHKVFNVSDARALLDMVVRTQEPDELKSLQPWPSQSQTNLALIKAMSPEDLVTAGWHVPPFHPRCRGLLSKVDRAPTITEAGNVIPVPEKYTATQEDFKQLGVKIAPAKVQLWNTLMGVAPAEVVAKVTGVSTASLLETVASVQEQAVKQAIGLKTLQVNPTGINIETEAKMFGSQEPIKQDLYFKLDQSLYIGSVSIPQKDAYVFKHLMKNLYGTAKATGMESMAVASGPSYGGWAFAKYGFAVTSAEAWAALKTQLSAKATPEVLATSSLEERKAFKAIMLSTDPKDIFALADLPTLGKSLLVGTSWQGALDFADPESLARFFQMMS